MYRKIEKRDCEFCGRETPHEITRKARAERITDCDVAIVKYSVSCKCCGAIYSEKRMVIPNE